MEFSGIVGEVLDGKYKIERQLGKGGMGSVYLATHIGTGRPVAVKVIAPEFMERAEFVERFRREAKAAGRLRHPNVVDVTDFGFSSLENGDEAAYLVMEYLDGCTLGEVLDEEGCLPVEFSIEIIEQVCSAVEEAHKQGVIHRDLKPDNIWLEPNQRGGYTVKVLDFGIAKLEEVRAADTQSDIPTQISQARQTVLNEDGKTVADSEGSDTRAKAGGDTLISESATAALPDESETLASEAGTMVQETPVSDESKEVDSESGTVLLPSGETKLIEPENNKRTKIISKADNTDKSTFEAPTTSDLTKVGAVLGTPLYMSPEQCRGEKLSARSDIYSLAVIVYQMLSGNLPFEGDYKTVMDGHKNIDPPPLAGKKTPKKLKGIVMQSLSKDAEARAETAEAFASKLRSNSEGLGVLLRRAIVIYSERMPKFLLLTVITFLPLIVLTFARVGFAFLRGFNVVEDSPLAAALSIGFVLGTFFLQIVAAAFLVGMTTWIVAQVLAYPLRPVSLRAAFNEVKKRWKPLTGTVTVSTIISIIGLAFCLLPGVWLSAKFMLIAPSIMMEGVRGKAAFKRSMELTKRSFRTVFATALLVYMIPGILAGTLGFSVGSIIRNFEMRSEINQMKKDGVKPMTEEERKSERKTISVNRKGILIEKNKSDSEEKSMSRRIAQSLNEGIFELIWTPIALLISSFTSVITALIYFKTRQAGGESMQELLSKLDDADQPQTKWQKRVKERLIQSGKISSSASGSSNS